MVRNNDAINSVIGGEFCVLLHENALEHDLHLDGVAQALDRIPVQVRCVYAGDAAYINAVEIRFACDIVLKSSAMAPIALPRISTPQPNERFPIHRRGTVDCNYNYGGSGSFRTSDKGFGNFPFPRRI